jgi:hypothetical protein
MELPKSEQRMPSFFTTHLFALISPVESKNSDGGKNRG